MPQVPLEQAGADFTAGANVENCRVSARDPQTVQAGRSDADRTSTSTNAPQFRHLYS